MKQPWTQDSHIPLEQLNIHYQQQDDAMGFSDDENVEGDNSECYLYPTLFHNAMNSVNQSISGSFTKQ